MIKTKYYKLDNGLIVAFAKKSKLHSFGAEIYIKYGSAHKNFKSNGVSYTCKDGIAHLLEHILIDNSPYGNLGRYYNENYYNFNGETYSDYTKYYIHGYENFEENLKILIDSINNSSFTPEGIEKSKYPVIEEIGEFHNSRNFDFIRANKKCMFNTEVFLDGLGSVQDVKDFSYDDIRLVYDTFYQPDNEIITVYGNFDEEKILKLIKDCFNFYDRDYRTHEIKEFKDTKEVKEKYVEYTKEGDMPLVSVNFKVDVSEFTLSELSRLDLYLGWFLKYNFSTSSEFGRKIIEDKISPYSVSTNSDEAPYGNSFIIIKVAVPTNECKEFVSRVVEQMEKREMPNKTKQDIYRKKKYIGRLVDMDSSKFMVTNFAYNYMFNEELEFAKIEDLNEISFKEMQEFVNKLDFSNYSVVYRNNK